MIRLYTYLVHHSTGFGNSSLAVCFVRKTTYFVYVFHLFFYNKYTEMPGG